nr:UvrD-like helicase, ATP-binding domain, P-loop containing nucleoside triphosphate hydrolase [Tanacetum cinerariifolium]
LPRKYKHTGQTSSNNVGVGTTPTSNTLPDVNTDINRVELHMNWKVVEEISEAINGNKGVAVNTLATAAMIKEEIDKNIGTLATILVDQKICSDKDAIVVRDAYEHFGLLSTAFDKSLTKRVGDEEASGVLENQTECDNTHDDNKKKGKGKKGKKSKKNKAAAATPPTTSRRCSHRPRLAPDGGFCS